MLRMSRRALCAGVASSAFLPKLAVADTQIELWSFLDPKGRGTRSAVMGKVISDFEAANPGVTVKTNVIQYAEIVPQLLRASKAGRVPDVVMVFSQFMPIAIGAGALQPLDAPLRSLSESDRRDIVTLPLSYDDAGRLYALPWELRIYGLIYRADLMARNGIARPKTLEELKLAGQRLATADMQAFGFSFDPNRSVTPMEWLLASVVGLGSKVLNDDGSAAFDNAQLAHMLGYFADLVDAKLLSVDTALTQSDAVENLAAAGKVGMISNGTHRLTTVQERSAPEAQWAFSVFPDIDAQRPVASDLQGWTLAIPNGARHAEIGWKLLAHWTAVKAQETQAAEAGYIPVRRSVMESASFNNEKNQKFGLIDAVRHATDRPLKTRWPANGDLLNDVFGRMVQQVITRRMSVADAMKWGVSTYDKARM